MSKIPCKKCSVCGMYNDLSVMICVCGADLSFTSALLTETNDIPVGKSGNINENVSVFVQKCPACGTLNFTSDKENRVQTCHNCTKRRVYSIDPEPYTENGNKSSAQNPSEESSTAAPPVFTAQTPDDAVVPDAAGNGGDGTPTPWGGMLGNISKAVGSSDASETHKEVPLVNSPVSKPVEDDDDEDDDGGNGVADWSSILGVDSAPKMATAEKRKPVITLSAVRYGRYSFTVEPKENEEYWLGRSANQSKFLSYDGRVSNKHCYLCFKGGYWFVKNNNASNGTFVNSNYIGDYGESRLNDGDVLVLGHETDSMAFRITIR